jgi:hypothetical protein
MKKEIKSDYYSRNREKRLEYQNKRYQELSSIYNEWRKTLSCSRCDENDVACLEFHHCNPSEKESNVIKNVAKGLKSTLNELKKCVVVCANCHSKIHAYNIETKPVGGLSESFEEFHNKML